MKRMLLGTTLLAALCVVSFWGVASAQSFRSGKTSTVAANETINHSLWIAGGTVDIAGQVNGDVFCAGQSVTVSGTIHGDLLCAAQSIIVSGVVDGDVRVLGQSFTLSGKVGLNLSAAAQSFSQSSKGRIGGDASVAAGDVLLNGTVGRDAAVAGATATIDGKVGRNLQAAGTNIALGSGAIVTGDFHYTSTSNASVARGASIGGATTKSLPQKHTGRRINGMFHRSFGFALYFAVAWLLLALAVVLFFPQFINTAAAHGAKRPWKALLVGLVAAIVVPVLMIVLFVTVVGIPLALFLMCLWLVVQAVAGVAGAYYSGKLLWRRQHNPLLITLVGVLVLTILYFIPILGGLVFIAVMLLGTGMILLEVNERRGKPSYKVE